MDAQIDKVEGADINDASRLQYTTITTQDPAAAYGLLRSWNDAGVLYKSSNLAGPQQQGSVRSKK